MNANLSLVVRGAVGAALSAALLGLAEALWLAATVGAPDGLAPVYGVVLYALIGAPIGLLAGVGLALARRVVAVTPQGAVAAGAIASAAPMGLFIGRYLANKVVYAEQGVPLPATLGLLAVAGVVALVVGLVLPRVLRAARPLDGVAGALSATTALLAVGGGWWAVHPAADPRDSWSHGKSAAQRPNVLILLVDTLRADHLGAYGAQSARTPAIDALAADSVLFEQAFAAASWTRASGASILTSRLPSGHTAALKASRLPDEVVTIGEALQPEGYASGALINNINLADSFNFDQGFDTFVYESPAYPFFASESVFGLTFYKVVQKVGERVLPGKKRVEQYYQPADVVLADAQGFIQANRQAPWSLVVHLMEPHDPYFGHPVLDGTAPDDYDGHGFARAEIERPRPEQADEMKRLYRGEVAFLDTRLAPFLKWLRDEGLYDNTIIVLTADHGEEFNEHGGFWHGTTLYDEQIHVPFVVKRPQQRDAGERVPWQVSSLDLAPTVLTEVGGAPDASWEGVPLQATIDAWKALHAPPPPPAAPVDPVAPASADPDGKPVPDAPAPEELPLWAPPGPCDPAHPLDRPVFAEEDFEGNQIAAIRAGGFKYIRANANNPRGLPEQELFHVADDRGETRNLHGTTGAICGSYPDSAAKDLDQQLGARIVASSAKAKGGGEAHIDAAECERLKALGYMDAATDCR